jgi:cytochrome c553
MIRQCLGLRHLAVALAAAWMVCTAARAQEPSAGQQKARACAVCHGQQGISVLPQAPHIAGQPEDYLAQQLKAYRSGKRHHEMMSLIAKPLSDDDIALLAAYFASFRIELKSAP